MLCESLFSLLRCSTRIKGCVQDPRLLPASQKGEGQVSPSLQLVL